jgi:hypothetical protein
VRLARFERALNALSTHSLCRLGYRRKLEDQVGLEPTKLAQRVKSPLPLPLGSLIRVGEDLVDACGYDPPADGLKVRSLTIWV